MQAIILSPGLNAAVKNLKEAPGRTSLHTESNLPVGNELSEAERKQIGIAFKDKKEPINAWY